jgi:hypothetical protein
MPTTLTVATAAPSSTLLRFEFLLDMTLAVVDQNRWKLLMTVEH